MTGENRRTDDETATDGGTQTGRSETTDTHRTSREKRGGLHRFDVSSAFGRQAVTLVLAATLTFLTLPILVTVVASFGTSWTGVIPTGYVNLDNWRTVLGLAEGIGVRQGVIRGLAYSAGLATAGMVINIVVGVPIAYSLVRYDFFAKDWINTLAILPIVPGVILAIAFLRMYPERGGSTFGLIIGYALLKSPFMVLTVQSSLQSMNLQQIEESARSLGASWIRTFLTVIVPNAKDGIIAGSIITWTLAAAEFNFTYIVHSAGPRPFSLFLFENITRSPVLQGAAAVSVYFLIVTAVIVLLQRVGKAGFTTVER
ncbi:putative spermidine/putrescine transport system permease protein [Halorubrum alkaliphilum]|uniref:Putative spermidine/putrescine transport system permease protein n=1 Tax=Halorubrum alkaliphilum TaxID=261290 RepID=A0A8T4GCW4_9EURY|nr:ABC transporter permease subunit [Halorubrum alkaliphilum]MBP1921966.1 putative spermidine/putrescine transport system permease protein [Halorubrum alkaliphilum]